MARLRRGIYDAAVRAKTGEKDNLAGTIKNRGAVADCRHRAPVYYGLLLVGQDKLPFGKLAVRHGLQLVYRCGGKLAHILVHVGHGRVDIINRPFPAVLGVNRNYVFFLNGKGCSGSTI